MKIAYIVRNYNTRGGISGYVAGLTQKMSRSNEVHVFASTIESASEGVIGHNVPCLSSNFLKSKKKHAWNVALEVASFMIMSNKYVNKGSYDIVHSQGDYRGGCDVYTAHSCHKAWLDIARKNEIGLIDGLKKSKINPLHWLILRSEYYGVERSKKIIAISDMVKKELVEYYPGVEGKIEVIYNGVDIERFSPENRRRWRDILRKEYSLKGSDIVAIFPAHEFRRKGLSQIIDAFANLRNDSLYLIVVGRDDPSGYEKEIKDKGLSGKIIFAGEQREIEKYYAAADMALLPTLYEPFGLVITEAMSSGLPVIITASAGAAELITDGIDGFLINDRNDPADLARKIKLLADNKDLLLKAGTNARTTAEKYSWELISGKTSTLYGSLINGRKT